MAKPIKKTLKKKATRKKRSTAEMIWVVISIILVFAMVATSVASLMM